MFAHKQIGILSLELGGEMQYYEGGREMQYYEGGRMQVYQ